MRPHSFSSRTDSIRNAVKPRHEEGSGRAPEAVLVGPALEIGAVRRAVRCITKVGHESIHVNTRVRLAMLFGQLR